MRQPPEEQRHDRHRQQHGELERDARDEQRHRRDDGGDRHDDDVDEVTTVAQPVREAAGGDRSPGRAGKDGEPPEASPLAHGDRSAGGGEQDVDEHEPGERQQDNGGQRHDEAADGRSGRGSQGDAPCGADRRPREHLGGRGELRGHDTPPLERTEEDTHRHDDDEHRDQVHADEFTRLSRPLHEGAERHAHASEQHAGGEAQDDGCHARPGRGAVRAPRDGQADPENENHQHRHAEESGEEQRCGQGPGLGTDDGETSRVEGVDRGGHGRTDREAEGHRRSRENGDDGRGEGAGIRETGRAAGSYDGGGDQDDDADGARRTSRRSPRRAPSIIASLRRRTCATTRGPPRRRAHRTAPGSAPRAFLRRAPRRRCPRRAPAPTR